MNFQELIFSHITDNNSDIAIIDSEGEHYSYTDLHKEITHAANDLNKSGLEGNDLLIINADKSFKSLAYILACIKLNIVYIPIDVDSPPKRTKKIILQSGANAILENTLQIKTISDKKNRQNTNACCVLYTSGSTGTPKGVICSKNGIQAFITWAIHEFKMSKDDRLTSLAPFHFDLSTFDIFAGIATGSSIWLVDKKLGSNMRMIGSLLEDINPSIIYTTPTTFRLLHQYGKISTSYQPRLALFAGEVFPISALNNLRESWPTTTFYNLYGPTETNVCTYFKVPETIEREREIPYPIGRPCDFATVTTDSTGQLLVGGKSLMLGYLNDSKLTRQLFKTHNAQTMYQTGDIVSEDNGVFSYRGRVDRMVKRNGFRIELGEIESIYSNHEAIESCAAIVVPGIINLKIFLIYTGSKISPIELSQFGKNGLMDYMIPDHYKYEKELPVSSNGKVDYKQLIANFNIDE